MRPLRGQNRRQDGATLVEFALVMPLIMLLFIGIMEFGMSFYDFLTVEQAAREGVRTGAFVGTAPDADCQIMTSIVDFLPNGFLDRVDRFEIYEATSDGDQIASRTNTWTYTGGDPDPCANPLLNWSVVEQWPSSTRQTAAGSQPLDIIGIRIQMTHNWITGFPPFTGSYVIDESTILRMEPEAFE
ncbi:MAG: pilus assembly protein [Actinobacteria bacterium]|nr:pilus assembly protein [Actinomycetota bacterium]